VAPVSVAAMRSAVMRAGEVLVRDDVADPQPAFGQVLVEVKACGICGSDLHFVKHAPTMINLAERMEGLPDLGIGPPDLSRDVFMGHEFSAEVLEVGPDTEGPAPGALVTSMPVMLTMTGVRDLAYNNELPGGYSERMLLSAPMLLEVPNGLDARRAAITEPMAVGLHAVNRSGIQPGEGAIVLGCGPIGLAVISALRLRGAEPVVASDFSRSRRQLGLEMGANSVTDPSTESPFDAWAGVTRGTPPVVFEAIGVPGILDEILRRTPMQSKVVVVGVCMSPDSVTPFYGIAKEANIQFVLGYDPMEFAASLRSIAEGEVDVAPMITGDVDISGIPGAFDALGHPDSHCKILVVPGLEAAGS
jgi:threonine dehydrogenase-like Zn-dependent dehydrogenase